MKSHTTRFITGLTIIALGIAILLGNFEIYNAKELVHDWWPLAVIIGGIIVFINDTRNYLWALFIVFVGILLELRQLDALDVNPWEFVWPAIFIFVGLSVMLNRSASRKSVSKSERDDATAILAGNDLRSTSDDFKGSKVTAIMGGVKIDLRKATIKKEATIEVFSLWGGVELVVPRNVVVKNQISAVLGGVEDKTDQELSKNSPVLVVAGDVIMAGVEIKN